MSFDFVFAYDEYLEYINTQYIDVFAFFISGPGIEGPYASPEGFAQGAQNIAFVPNSNPPLPITISSVNDVLNSEYYIDNPDNALIGMDGFTTVFTATQENLQIGEVYHIRLAIGDAHDTIFGTSVFLDAGSFSCYQTVGPFAEGDFNGDSALDTSDLLIIIGEMGCTVDCTADLNGDGIVNVWDIVTFLGLFGE